MCCELQLGTLFFVLSVPLIKLRGCLYPHDLVLYFFLLLPDVPKHNFNTNRKFAPRVLYRTGRMHIYIAQ